MIHLLSDKPNGHFKIGADRRGIVADAGDIVAGGKNIPPGLENKAPGRFKIADCRTDNENVHAESSVVAISSGKARFGPLNFGQGEAMGARMSKIDDFLFHGLLVFEAALADPAIKARAAEYGYEEARLNQGLDLGRQAQALHFAQKKEYGDQIGATSELNRFWESVNSDYIKALKLARIGMATSVRLVTALVLSGARKESLSGWIAQAEAFYTNLQTDPEAKQIMARFGYDEKRIQDEHARVERLCELVRVQKKETGEAQIATKVRDAKLDEFAQYVGDFKKVIRIAFEDAPQALEKLGIVVRG